MICPVCNKNVRVRKNGTFSKHRNSQPVKYWSYWCPGSCRSAQQANAAEDQPPGAKGSNRPVVLEKSVGVEVEGGG